MLSWTLILALAATPEPGPRPGVGDPAPAAPSHTLEGAVLPPAALRGQITVVQFFATWCLPCHRSLEDLEAVRTAMARPGTPASFAVLLVNAAEPRETIKRFLRQRPPPAGARVALDPDGSVGRAWGRDRLPTTFIVDANGVIRHINRGHGAGFRARLHRWLRRLGAPSTTAPQD